MKRLLIIIAILLFAMPAQAAIYRFSTSGSDDGDGSVANPYKTISYANTKIASLSPGDKVLLKAGDEWNLPAEWNGATHLEIGVSGTVGNVITVGAYDAAHPDGLVRTDTFTRPILNGDTDGNGVANLPGTTWSVSYYTGLIAVNGNSYVTVENIHVKYSLGYGIEVDGEHQISVGHIIVHNCKSEHTQHGGIAARQDSSDNIFEYNEVTTSSEVNEASGVRYWPVGDPYPSHWPAGLGAGQDSLRLTSRYNYIHHNWGEGAYNFSGSNDGIIEYNRVVNNWAVQIYVCNVSNTTVRYNLVHGTTDNTFWRVGYTAPSNGIWAGPELANLETMTGLKIYGNMVAYVNHGIRLNNSYATDLSAVIYNNTVVDAVTSLYVIKGAGGTSLTATIKNNAFIKYDASIPTQTYSSGTLSITKGYNYWYGGSAPSGTFYDAGTDITSPTPLLTKTSGWTSIATPTLTDSSGGVNGSDFTPQVGSPLIDAVDGIGGAYNTLVLSGSTWPTSVTTGDATTHKLPVAPTWTAPTSADEPNIILNPTCTSSAYAESSTSTPVDFGAIQLSDAGGHTQTRWQMDLSPSSWAAPYYDTTSSTALVSISAWAVGLTASTHYDARVKHYNSAGWGPWSSVVTFETGTTSGGGPGAGTPTWSGSFTGSF